MASSFFNKLKGSNNTAEEKISANLEGNSTETNDIILSDLNPDDSDNNSNSSSVNIKSIKINKLHTDTESSSVMSVNQFEEGFTDDMFGFTFEIKSPDQMDAERKKTTGLTLNEMYFDLDKRQREDERILSDNIDEYYLEQAVTDLSLIYKKLKSMLIFTSPTYRSILNQAIKKVEKIIASDDSFYKKDQFERAKILTNDITGKLPGNIMTDFSEFVSSENDNSFGMYYEIYNKIKAQDFILTSNFLNVQYDNRNFFYVDVPDYLIDINNLLVNHLCIHFLVF